jgi:L-alanine-DL-glutamate epimerase-like enolase superfamily enzyme
MPWWDKIYKEPYRVKDGFIEVPKVPGIGLEIDAAALKKYEMK